MALPDVVVIGAGVVGAACAYYASRAGLSVTVLDRGPVAGGTTSAGGGSLLVSDKPPGPLLDLALDSLHRWIDLGAELGANTVELARRGGLAVAVVASEVAGLNALAARQRNAGVDAVAVSADALRDYEPHLSADLAGGVYYRQDLHVQPVLAAAHLLRASGARVHCGVDVRGVELGRDMRVAGVRTTGGDVVACGTVVNAGGVWAGDLAARTGTPLPVTPRQSYVLVTEPLSPPRVARREPPVRHTVYDAGHAVTGDGAPAVVVAGTRAGTVLIGTGRDHADGQQSWSLPALRRLATQAVALLPFLAGVSALRAYRGFRPNTPDRLPLIGPDPWIAGLYHACGHGGAGVCLAPATGALVAGLVTNAQPAVDPEPFHPERFG